MSTKLISIITPVLNEADNLQQYYFRVSAVIDAIEADNKYRFEIIFTDNRSTDDTFAIIQELASKDRRIRAFRFSRNFGYQNSIFTGYRKARGDAAIELDCDLQDPPEMIASFISKWEEGFDIVYGIRQKRKEGLMITYFRTLFYRMINRLSEIELPHDAGDFMLVDRKIIAQLVQVQNVNLYIRGLVFSFGFEKIGIPYTREKRMLGASKFSYFKLVNFALDGIINMSTAPLRLASYLGILIASVTLLVSIVYIVLKLSGLVEWPSGFTTNIVVLLFGISINALFLGIIGEYLGRLVIQSRNLPRTIITDEIESVS